MTLGCRLAQDRLHNSGEGRTDHVRLVASLARPESTTGDQPVDALLIDFSPPPPHADQGSDLHIDVESA